jgi:hypothetical protein
MRFSQRIENTQSNNNPQNIKEGRMTKEGHNQKNSDRQSLNSAFKKFRKFHRVKTSLCLFFIY